MKSGSRIVLNAVVFQAAWFACVLGGANDLALAGTLTVVGVIAMHLALAPRAMPEALLIAAATAIGLAWESAVVASGLIRYTTGNLVPGLAPYWIVAMWALFATSLNLSMAWLKGRPWLAVLAGGIGGPLAYLAGGRLGGLEMPDPLLALGAQAIGWAVLLPVLVRLASRLDGFAPAAPTSPAAWSPVTQEARHNV